MQKDFGKVTLHVNRYTLTNFGLGFDYYHEEYWQMPQEVARVIQLSFIFFNVTLTFWKEGL